MNKKAIIFTLLSSVMIMITLFFLTQDVDTSFLLNYKKEQALIKFLTFTIQNLEESQLKKIGFGLGYKTLFYMAYNRTRDLGFYTSKDQINREFNEIFTGKRFSSINFTYYLIEIKEVLKEQGINISFSKDIDTYIYEENPFLVSLKVNISYNISFINPQTSFIKIRRNATLLINIPIFGIPDPLFSYYTDYKQNISYMLSPFDDYSTYFLNISQIFMSCYQNYIDNLANETCVNLIYNNSYTKFSPDAPSFLNRLMNKRNPSECCGIEILLNLSEVNKLNLAKIGISKEELYNRSFIDYCLYYNQCEHSNSTCKLYINYTNDGIRGWALIDARHAVDYLNETYVANKEIYAWGRCAPIS